MPCAAFSAPIGACATAGHGTAGCWWSSAAAEALFFGTAPALDFEPARLKVSEEDGGEALLVAEVKWAALARAAKAALARDLESRFRRTQLGQRWTKARFEVLDQSALKTLE